MRGLYVPLSLDEKNAFIDLAERRYRDPRHEARLLLVEAMRAAGALPSKSSESDRSVDQAAALSGAK